MVKVGLDLGGTKLFGIVTIRGDIVKQKKSFLQDIHSPEKLAGYIGEFYRKLVVDYPEVDTVGLAVPSPVDIDKGIAKNMTAFRWENIAMGQKVEDNIGKPVRLENDVNAATLAEYKMGAGRGVKSLYTFYPGTGLGGGYISEGSLVRGYNYTASEVGHMVVQMDGFLCNCGQRGCLEAIVSNRGFKRMMDEHLKKGQKSSLTENDSYRSDDLVQAWQNDDKVVKDILSFQARALGLGVANVINVTGVERIIIGGNVYHKLEESLFPIVRETAVTHSIGGGMNGVEIRLNELGNEAPALGMTLV